MLNTMVKFKMASLHVLLSDQENASNLLPVIDFFVPLSLKRGFLRWGSLWSVLFPAFFMGRRDRPLNELFYLTWRVREVLYMKNDKVS